MEFKKFDNWEFEQALTFININPLEAKLRYEKYIRKYPKDYCAYSFLSSSLITLGQFEQAEEILIFVKNLIDKDKQFQKDINKITLFKKSFYFNQLRLLSYQNKYEEAYNLCIEQLQNIENIEDISFYCKSKLGKLNNENRGSNSYLFRQIIKYDEKDFFYHIQKHLADYNLDTDLPNQSVFKPNFPINEVIEEIKKYIPSKNRLCPGLLDDTYIFKFNNCGKDNNRITDYFKVVCFHDTQNIITMFPSNHCKHLPYIDLNYLTPEDKNIKVKVNQIDKFNRKYKRK